MALDRSTVKLPVLAKRTVPAPALGGEVIVREQLLDEKLGFGAAREAMAKQLQPGEAPEAANARAGVAMVPRVLHLCVIQPDGQPLMSEAEWRAFGGQHLDEALALFNVAMELSGFDLGAVEKN